MYYFFVIPACTDTSNDHTQWYRQLLETADDSDDIITRLEQKELWQQIAVAAAKIPVASREACWLHFEKGLKIRAIARILNLPYSAVYNRLAWALYLLQTQFAKKPKNPV